MDESRLFDDIHAVETLRELGGGDQRASWRLPFDRPVMAIERGRREDRSGAVEEYERVEFYRRHTRR